MHARENVGQVPFTKCCFSNVIKWQLILLQIVNIVPSLFLFQVTSSPSLEAMSGSLSRHIRKGYQCPCRATGSCAARSACLPSRHRVSASDVLIIHAGTGYSNSYCQTDHTYSLLAYFSFLANSA